MNKPQAKNIITIIVL